MENSRHERALVVVASYVIGFASAYIAFGVSQSQQIVYMPVVSEQHQVAKKSVIASPTASLRVEDDGLVLATQDKERLLTARKSSPLVASLIQAGPTPGFAEKLTEAELSRDSEYVYFCEQLTPEAESCDAYVYSVNDDVLYPVQINGEVYTPNNASHVSAWSPAGYLTIGEYQSASTETPWILQ